MELQLEQLEMSWADLGRELGMKGASIYQLKERDNWQISMFQRVAEALEVSPLYLIWMGANKEGQVKGESSKDTGVPLQQFPICKDDEHQG